MLMLLLSMNDSNFVSLTSEMYEQLVKLLNSQRNEQNVNVNMTGVFVNTSSMKHVICGGVLDSGATDHMLFDIKDVSKNVLPVNLPNGLSVLVKYVGKCRLTHNIVLNNILYVSDVNFNLLIIH